MTARGTAVKGEGSQQATRARSQASSRCALCFPWLLEGISCGFCRRLTSLCQQLMPETLQAHSGGFKGSQRGPGGQTQPTASLPGSEEPGQQGARLEKEKLDPSCFLASCPGPGVNLCLASAQRHYSIPRFYPSVASLEITVKSSCFSYKPTGPSLHS